MKTRKQHEPWFNTPEPIARFKLKSYEVILLMPGESSKVLNLTRFEAGINIKEAFTEAALAVGGNAYCEHPSVAYDRESTQLEYNITMVVRFSSIETYRHVCDNIVEILARLGLDTI